MTQKSIPWPRGVAADSLVGYTAQEWAGIWAEANKAGGIIKIAPNLRTIAALANIGVFYSVANRLAVTNPGGAANRIDVNTGSALVCGHAFYNDTSIGAAGDITSPAANPRIDRVVVRCNFAAADYVPASASAALFTVPAYTARVTIIHGAEDPAPTPPALTQDTTLATYWDIPLYQYQISVAGAITALTDEREWVDAETKYGFIPALGGYDVTAPATLHYSAAQSIALIPPFVGLIGALELVDTHDCYAYGQYVVPEDYISDMVLTAIIVPLGAGDAYIGSSVAYGDCPDIGASVENIAIAAVAVAVQAECVLDTTLTAPAVGDLVSPNFQRDASDVLDTLGANVDFFGWRVSYLGWR